MSQKVVLAVAATAALIATTEARGFPTDWSSTGPYNPQPPSRPFDEDEQVQKINWGKVVKGVNTGLDLYGKAKGVGLFEEGNNYWEVGGGASNGGNWNINGKIGGTFDEEEEAQKIKWGKVVKGIHTGLDLYGKAKGVGLFEEEEEAQKLKLGKIVKGINTGLDLFGKAKSVGLFDEEEGNNYWEVSGGASNGGNWNINGKIGGTFDEEELQKLKLGSALHTAANVLIKADKLGLLEEDADMDEVQKLKLGKVIGGAVKVVKVAGAVGLLEEGSEWTSQQSGKDLKDFWGALDKVIDNIKETTGQTKLFDEESFVAPTGGFKKPWVLYDEESFVAPRDGKYRPGVFYDEESIIAPQDGKVYPPWIKFDEEEAIWPPGTGGIKPPREFIAFDEAEQVPEVAVKQPKKHHKQQHHKQHHKRSHHKRPELDSTQPHPSRKSLLHKKLKQQERQ